ncbi:hypothetical protein ABS767_03730 [Sphingomonas sp. ST-64]|uniref:4-O-methyl-glucuronoyl methylesterase-like domain-containing protein n=1 Tax=Sphingomonas plantiphila TaxID=3163295 RepID=A0ABW8YJA5_9SPHN
MRAMILALAMLAPAPAVQQDDRAAEADRAAMLQRLGIAATRTGADGFDPTAPNAANYDEAKAVMAGPLPPLMRLADGRIVRTASDWAIRRAEIVALFDREIYGRVPPTAPAITWRVVREERGRAGEVAVVRRWLEGVADNRGWPAASATLALRLTLPAEPSAKRVAVILSFGLPDGFRFPGPPRAPDPGPSPTEQLVRAGFGHAILVANSVQADNGGELDDGVIGISLRGNARAPDDWGVLRAWAWGASRAFDALAAMPQVDPARIGIEGLSRYGKAALVTMAYDRRFAIGFAGSSGAGGAALYRRDFGERIGNLAAGGEYHWFAGNFLRYAAPPLSEADLPIDSHMLIALAAPRALFLGAGTVDTGDGWVDPKGSFLAAAAATPAWSVQGTRGLAAAEFPPILSGVTDGWLGWRQHRGGHSNRDNWPSFIAFATARLDR